MPVPARFTAAVALLDVQPGDTVLEVGGGTGVSAGLICSRLDGGRLIAVDRSAKATARIVDRNPDHVAEGRLEAVTAALDNLDVPAGSVDRALALNVNVFWTGSADAELEVIAASDDAWRADAAERARAILDERRQLWGAELPAVVGGKAG